MPEPELPGKLLVVSDIVPPSCGGLATSARAGRADVLVWKPTGSVAEMSQLLASLLGPGGGRHGQPGAQRGVVAALPPQERFAFRAGEIAREGEEALDRLGMGWHGAGGGSLPRVLVA